MSNYKISIIIPVYNVKKYIAEAMDSLLNQTIGFENLEVIFADDCSTDNSGNMIDEYAARYSNVRAIHLEVNSGSAGIPRNEAMKLATAEYLMFLDPDDYYYKNACNVLFNKISSTNGDIVSGYYSTIDANGNIIDQHPNHMRSFKIGSYQLPQHLDTVLQVRGNFWCKIYRKSIVIRHNIEFPPYIPGQDNVFICHYFLKCSTFEYINEPIYFYRLRIKDDKSISSNLSFRFFMGMSAGYKMVVQLFMETYAQSAVPILLHTVLDFYVSKMIESCLEKDELIEILKEWKWLFDLEYKQKMTKNSSYSQIIMGLVINGRLEESACVLEALNPLRSYVVQLENAKNWLADQQNKKDAAIIELQSYSKQLESTVNELREWATQLEEAKNYHQKQSENFENSLHDKKFEETIKEQEKAIEALMNKNKKLAFYLKEEINKAWYNKLIHKSSESDYNL